MTQPTPTATTDTPEETAAQENSAPRPADTSELEKLARRVDAAVAALAELDPEAKAAAGELKQAIEAFHKEGLATIIRTLKDDPRGMELLLQLADDPAVYALFAMHGLVRADLATRVAQVLDASRPYLQSHGGDVELVKIEEKTVFVRLSGACNGCSMSAVTLRKSVEEALVERIPEIESVEEVQDGPQPALVSIESLKGKKGGWQRGPTLVELAHARPYRLDLGETSVVLIRLGDRVQAFRNACAHQGLAIDGGHVEVHAEGDGEEATLTCPWHGFRFDAMSGECLTAPQAQLEPFPLRIEDGVVWVRPL